MLEPRPLFTKNSLCAVYKGYFKREGALLKGDGIKINLHKALIGDILQIICWFLRREVNKSTYEKKPLGARTRTNNKPNPHLMPNPGIKLRPHWCEASALTNVPSLLPQMYKLS